VKKEHQLLRQKQKTDTTAFKFLSITMIVALNTTPPIPCLSINQMPKKPNKVNRDVYWKNHESACNANQGELLLELWWLLLLRRLSFEGR
jgi:hypothetical protein